MANEVRADPVELARVAQTYLDNSKDLAAALRAVRPHSTFDAERMPDPVTSVALCLGAVLARDVLPLRPPTPEGAERYSLLGPQHLFCSEPLAL